MSGNAVPPFKGTITAGSSPVKSTKLSLVNVVIRWFGGNVTELGVRFKSDAGYQNKGR